MDAEEREGEEACLSGGVTEAVTQAGLRKGQINK